MGNLVITTRVVNFLVTAKKGGEFSEQKLVIMWQWLVATGGDRFAIESRNHILHHGIHTACGGSHQ